MARDFAKGKKSENAKAQGAAGHHSAQAGASAHAGLGKAGAAQEKGASAHAMGQGVCIICGEISTGTPALPEFPIRAARKLRAILKQPAKHTIACKEHLAEARQHRAKFEKKQQDYLLGAVAFFALVLFGGLFFGKLGISTFLPAILGAAIIAFLPFFYYFPSFGK